MMKWEAMAGTGPQQLVTLCLPRFLAVRRRGHHRLGMDTDMDMVMYMGPGQQVLPGRQGRRRRRRGQRGHRGQRGQRGQREQRGPRGQRKMKSGRKAAVSARLSSGTCWMSRYGWRASGEVQLFVGRTGHRTGEFWVRGISIIIQGYMGTWVHGYMDTWTHHTWICTYVLWCCHAVMLPGGSIDGTVVQWHTGCVT